MKTITHEVLDLHYHPEEGQGCFAGTEQECHDFVSTQSPHFMYSVVPLTKEQADAENEARNRRGDRNNALIGEDDSWVHDVDMGA